MELPEIKCNKCGAVNDYYTEVKSNNNVHRHWISCNKGERGAMYGYLIWMDGYYNLITVVDETKTEVYEKPPFSICAPIKDFDTERLRIKDGYKLCEIPDPIVLQPVKGGYLVVSKWGLEASDGIVVNQQMN